MVDHAEEHPPARVGFESVIRDRLRDGSGADSCGGIGRQPWDFCKVPAGYGG